VTIRVNLSITKLLTCPIAQQLTIAITDWDGNFAGFSYKESCRIQPATSPDGVARSSSTAEPPALLVPGSTLLAYQSR